MPEDEQAQGRTDEHSQVTKVACIIEPIEWYGGFMYFQ